MYEIANASNFNDSLLWWRIAYIGVIFIPIFLLHFIYEFLELPKKWLLSVIYLIGLFFLIINFVDGLFIRDANYVFNQFYYLSSPPPFYLAFMGMFFAIVVFVLFSLWWAQRSAYGTKKSQLKYLFWALLIGFGGGATSFLPVFKIYLYPVLNATISLGILIVAYAILRYRFMDLRVVARKMVIYFFSAAFVYGMFYFVSWIYEYFFGSIYSKNSYILGLAIAPLFVLLFVWLNEKIKGIANKYLFFSLYSSQETIAKLSDELTTSIDLDKIVDSIVNSIKNAMQLDRAGILLIDQNGEVIKYKTAKVIGFNENNGISLVQDNFLTRYLEKTQKPLVRDELQMIARDLSNVSEKQNFNQLAENMKHIEASLCLPMIISNKLIGIIVLGSKISSDAYTSEDLTLLNTLSKQAAIAVDNARLYKQVQEFSKTLQQKIDEQTKDIKEAYEVEKQAHEELKRLDETKSQFMTIANHHLRTPLTAINWYTDLLISGKYGKVPQKSKEVIDKIKEATTDEIKIVSDLLDISQFQLGTDIVNLKPDVNIENMLKQIVSNAEPEIQQKGIYLKIEKETENETMPLITADESKLKVAIINIIDNAVKYTEKGGVTITLEIEKLKNEPYGEQAIKIAVKDTGIGMNETELKNLFVKTFERGAKAKELFATGKGISLYLSAEIVKAHNGKLWAESEGRGKGSAFYVELPV